MRGAPLAAFLVFAIAALVWLGRDPSLRRSAYPPGSSLGTGASGTSLARAFLAQRGLRVANLTEPLARARLPRDAVLLRIAPRPELPDLLAALGEKPGDGPDAGGADAGEGALDAGGANAGASAPDAGGADAGAPDAGAAVRTASAGREPASIEDASAWASLSNDDEDLVRRGGRLVLALEGPALPDAGPARKVLPGLPGVEHLAPAKARALAPRLLVDAQPVFEHGEFPSVARRALGAGEVWLLSEPEVFFNAHLGEADHLALLLALAGDGRPVVFDEVAHGLRAEGGVFSILRRWGLGPALLLAALALAAAFWRRRITVGPPADPFRDARAEAVDLVDSMAALYDRALAPAEALQLYRARFVHEIALRRGVSAGRAEALAREALPGLDLPREGERLSAASFRTQLSILVHAFQRFRP